MYRHIVGSLIYMTITRPYLSYAVGQVSQFMQASRKPHLDAARRILRYVKSTLNYGLFYEGGGHYRYMDTQMLTGLVVSQTGDLLVVLCFPLGVLPSVGAARRSRQLPCQAVRLSTGV